MNRGTKKGLTRFASTLCALIFLFTSAVLAQESILYSFNDLNGDGFNPVAGPTIDSAGNIYGTLFTGGANGIGAVFKLSPSNGGWNESLLYSFGTYPTDGFWISGGVVLDTAGNVYGTAQFGGAYNKGMIYELTPAQGGGWTQTVLVNFDGANGTQPHAGLTWDTAGNLYGTAAGGGAYSSGTVFELSPAGSGSWNLTVLYSFGAKTNDGNAPLGGVTIDSAGNLYGTTQNGGGTSSACPAGCGIAYKLSSHNGHWSETILHNFNQRSADGQMPICNLTLDASGNIYGSTQAGGANKGGIVFELIPSGKGWQEKVLHSFVPGRKDGYADEGGVIFDTAGNLYGATNSGGDHNQGTIFRLTPGSNGTWTESLIYSFADQNNGDARNPGSGLVLSNGVIFGTTDAGGSYDSGTVFQVTP